MTHTLPDRLRRRAGLAALVALLAVAASACSGGRDALTIYSGRTQDLIGPLLERYAEEEGVAIDVKYGDSAELALLLAEEGDQTDADVFIAQNPGAVAFLADQGLLAPIDDEVLALVGERFRDPAGRWVGLTGRQRVLVYNTDLVDPATLPSSVDGVTDPAIAGTLGVAPQNGSFQDFVSAMIVARGEEATAAWLDALAAGGARTYANNNAIVDAVGRGEVSMGLVNHYYTYRFLDEDPATPIANHRFAPDDLGSLVIASTASVLSPTDKPDGAREFLAYLVGDDAQTYFRGETFEYPAAPGLDPAEGVPPLDPAALPEVDVEALGETLRTTTQLIARSALGR